MSLAMRRILSSSFFIWVLALAGILFFLYPLRKSLRFGIDLVGGSYIMLQADIKKAVEADLTSRLTSLESILGDGFSKENASVVGQTLEITAHDSAQAREFADRLSGMWKDMSVTVEGSLVKAKFTDAAVNAIRKDAVDRNIEVLRSRLDQLGASEITIAPHGENNIIIELPDVKDPQQAKAMIGKAAVLEFRLVTGHAYASKEDAMYDFGGDLPSNLEILPGQDGRFYVVSRYAEVGGTLLKDARPGVDQYGKSVVNFQFNSQGSNLFYELTSKNIGRQLAVVLDGVVITAPKINSAISDSGQITGSGSVKESKELALLLRSGSFVAPVTFEQESAIGPSLGEQAVKNGLLACAIALGLLFVFSISYYKIPGLFAFIALAFNMILILFGLSQLGATLTLPGIAGIVLTLGMAIDASILIYERIKEELAAGNPLPKAVDSGFSNAMTVILDANITTFIVAAVLYWFGTGPVQGFAVTMMLGIVSTLITGLFFLRSIFSFAINNFAVKNLKF